MQQSPIAPHHLDGPADQRFEDLLDPELLDPARLTKVQDKAIAAWCRRHPHVD